MAIGMSGFERRAVRRATPVTIGDTRIPVVSIEDLLVMKALAGRLQDDQDIRGLVAAQRDVIDYSACLELAERLGEAVDRDVDDDTLGLHAQQAAEKLPEAALISRNADHRDPTISEC